MTEQTEKAGKNLADVQDMNRALVLRTIWESGTISRADIAKQTGLQQTTVTNIVGTLLSSEIVQETSLIKGARGRRSIGLSLSRDRYGLIAMRLTRHFILAGVYDMEGRRLYEAKVSIAPQEGASAALAIMKRTIADILSRHTGREILGIGIGTPGPFLRKDGRLAQIADFPGWENVSFKEELEPAFDLKVLQEFDAYADAMAEWWYGMDSRTQGETLLSVSMEQGIGAGLVIDGQIYHGEQGLAGSIGHISIDHNGPLCTCGNRGCLRNYCMTKAVLGKAEAALAAGEASSLGHGKPLTLDALIAAAVAGDPFAREQIVQAATYMGYGLINVIHTVNPTRIVLSAEFRAAGDLYLGAIDRVLRERLLPSVYRSVQVRFTHIQEDPVLMGMAYLLINWVLNNPSLLIEDTLRRT